MTTLRDVAKKANVSLATASRVANGSDCVLESTRHKVLSVMHDLNYTYIYRQHAKKDITIAVLIPKPTLCEIANHPSVQAGSMGVVHQCDESKVRNTILPLDLSDLKKSIFSYSPADAYILMATSKAEEDRIIPMLQEKNIPFVLINRWIDMRNISYVNVNDYKAFYESTISMIQAGHTQIGMINGPADMRNSMERLKGFMDACESKNIPIHNDWIFHGSNDEANGIIAADSIMRQKQRPTCMMTSYDVMAKGFINRVQELGLKVPNDISVVGWGDVSYAAYLSPSLTTIRMPSFEMGVEAAKAALQLLQNPLINQLKITLNCQLIKRESTRSLI